MTTPETEIPLNPNIRRTVEWLQAHGFDTSDSGDGETHACECDRDYGYVAMKVAPDQLITETRRLFRLLTERGLSVVDMNDADRPCIQGSYDPGDDSAVIDLIYINDDIMGLNAKSLS